MADAKKGRDDGEAFVIPASSRHLALSRRPAHIPRHSGLEPESIFLFFEKDVGEF
jgi:hypothetical protein